MRTLLIAACAAVLPLVAEAQPVRYDITVSAAGVIDAASADGPQFGTWVRSGTPPFGVTLPATFSGYVIADPSKQAMGFGSILDFRLTLGTKTWTWADWVGGPHARAEYVGGHLAEFWPFAFTSGDDAMQLWAIRPRPGRTDKGSLSYRSADGWAFCNDCASLGEPVSVVPEPSTYQLLLAGLLGLGYAARQRRRSRVAAR